MTAMASGWPVAHRLVPSSGSTAMSTLGDSSSPSVQPLPTRSPMNSIGASSRSPSPMTTVPRMSMWSKARRIASTATWSARLRSPRPMRRADARAAASVMRTTSSARLRSSIRPPTSQSTMPAGDDQRRSGLLRIAQGRRHDRAAQRVGQRPRPAVAVDDGVAGEALGEELAVTADQVLEAEAGAAHLGDLDLDVEEILVVGRLPVAAVGLDHRQGDAPVVDVLVGAAEAAPVRRARALEEAQVVGVVHDTHLVGVAEDDADLVDHFSPAIRIRRAGSTITGSAAILSW